MNIASRLVGEDTVKAAVDWWVKFYTNNEVQCHNPRAIGYTRQYMRAVREVAMSKPEFLESVVAEYLNRRADKILHEPMFASLKTRVEQSLHRANHG